MQSHASAALLVTEIMYNPASEPGGDYGWFEVLNTSDTAIDLSGYVFGNQSWRYGISGAGHVPDGFSIEGNSTGIIFGSVTLGPEVTPLAFPAQTDVWDPDSVRDINYIPLIFPDCKLGSHAPYCEMYLSRGTQTQRFGLWSPDNWDDSWDYRDFDFSTATIDVTYQIGKAGFPSSNDSASIYLVDPNGDPADGSNWALSQSGVDGAYTVQSPAYIGVSPGYDVGSPGYVHFATSSDTPSVPEPLSILGSLAAVAMGFSLRNQANGSL
jgi:hypothetical protein